MTASSPTRDPALDPTRCPLCGKPNACAMACAPANTKPETPCWCVNEQFPPALLQRVPVHLQRKACICASCARAARSSTTAS